MKNITLNRPSGGRVTYQASVESITDEEISSLAAEILEEARLIGGDFETDILVWWLEEHRAKAREAEAN